MAEASGSRGQSLAARQARTGSRTAARVRWSRVSVGAADQVVANGGQVGARLTALQGGQALQDARSGLAVTEDFQRRLQALRSSTESRTASG